MKKIMHILFLSCIKATELIEKKLHFKLSFAEKIQLKLHKMMCDACTKYEKQSDVIDKALFNSNKKEEPIIDINGFKKSILTKLEKPK
jgi:hypothetical protein